MKCNNCGAERTESHCDYCGSGTEIKIKRSSESSNINSSFYTSKKIERFIIVIITFYVTALYIYSIFHG